MSMMETGQPVDDQEMPSSTPPDITVGGSSKTLDPNQRLSPRKISGAAPDVVLGKEEEQLISKDRMYTGQKLVDSKGIIRRGQYTDDEAYSVLASFQSAERRGLLNIFQQVGIFGRGKPDAGFSERNLSAVREAMLYANYKGVTLDVAATMMLADPEFQKARAEAGSAARLRTSPKQDLRAVFKQAARSTLGRELPDSEVERFVRAYNAAEVREAMGGAPAPSAAVAAEEQIQTRQGAEAGAMGVVSLANIMDRAIKELG